MARKYFTIANVAPCNAASFTRDFMSYSIFKIVILQQQNNPPVNYLWCELMLSIYPPSPSITSLSENSCMGLMLKN